MIDFEAVQRQVSGHAIVREVTQLPTRHVRIETAFLYPEGSAVDVFLIDETRPSPAAKLSDLANTSQWLLNLQVQPWLSKKRQAYVDDALRIYNVTKQGGALELELASLERLIDGVVRLGQACVRVADLIYTRRSSIQLPVTDEVEEVLADAELDYDQNPELEGRYGRPVRVDFLVRGARTTSAVLTLSSRNASQAHVQANEIFSRWYDLDVPARRERRVTILDDRSDVYRDDDLQRLREKSDVLALSERTTICDLFAA